MVRDSAAGIQMYVGISRVETNTAHCYSGTLQGDGQLLLCWSVCLPGDSQCLQPAPSSRSTSSPHRRAGTTRSAGLLPYSWSGARTLISCGCAPYPCGYHYHALKMSCYGRLSVGAPSRRRYPLLCLPGAQERHRAQPRYLAPQGHLENFQPRI
jgi:hypothetical protein